MIRRVWRGLQAYIVGERRTVFLLACVSVVAGIGEATSLLFAIRIALDLSAGGDGSIDLPVGMGHMGVGLAIGISTVAGVTALLCHVAVADLSGKLAAAVLTQSRSCAIAKFVEAGWPTQAVQREGALQETVTTLTTRTQLLMYSLTVLGANGVSLAMFVITSLVVDPLTATIVVVVGVGIAGFLRPIARRTRRAARAFTDANSTFAEDVSRLTGSSMELKVFGVQREAEAELGRTNERVGGLLKTLRFWSSYGSSLYKDLAVLLLVGAVGILSRTSHEKLAGIGVVVSLMVRSLASAQQVNSSYQQIAEGASGFESMQRRIEALAAGAQKPGELDIPLSASIEFRSVGYAYSAEVVALSDISFTLHSGDALGVIGPSGGGKSTLIQILLRLRLPKSGAVTVGGIDYQDLDDAEWAQLIGFVPQEPTLLEASVFDNIAYYRDIDRVTVEAAAREANVYKDIARLPNGFDTMLGPRGSGLSGGQKQRVAIARALVGSPQILVMDEPSSALDVHSEQLLQQTLQRLKGKATMVIIAHRLKTVEACDRLLVLEHGRIQQLATPEELMKRDGFYSSIRAQLA